jgi:pSer/pThr/pTyr-binding forkhead associated (FHA) protein
VITCPKCSKDNQDHYKFCLGCGAELPRGAAPKPFSPQTPPHGMRAAPAAPAGGGGLGGTVAIPQQASPLGQAARPATAPAAAVSAVAASVPAAAPAAGTVVCPQCGHVNAASNLFCGSCGFRLGVPAAAPRAAAPPSVIVAADPGATGMTLTALRADGTEAGTYQVPSSGGIVGRESGGIFAGDSYLSPRHASFRVTGAGRAGVKDEGSLNGVYKKLARDVPTELRPNDVFRIGQEIIRFEPLATQAPSADGVERLGAPSKGYIGRIALVIGREETGNAFPIPESGVHLGRERGDVLFPEDGYVSGLHCRLTWDGRKLFLTDLGSSNGTFLRVSEAELRIGDVLLMGQQLFRVGL